MLDTCEESIFYEIYCSSLLWKAFFAVALRATCRSPHGAEEGQEKRGEEKKIPKVLCWILPAPAPLRPAREERSDYGSQRTFSAALTKWRRAPAMGQGSRATVEAAVVVIPGQGSTTTVEAPAVVGFVTPKPLNPNPKP